MPIRTVCPRCSAVYHVPENLLGKTLRCKECEHRWPPGGRSQARAAEASRRQRRRGSRKPGRATAPPPKAARPAPPGPPPKTPWTTRCPASGKKAKGSKVALLVLFIGLGSVAGARRGRLRHLLRGSPRWGTLKDTQNETPLGPQANMQPQFPIQQVQPVIPVPPGGQPPAVSTAEPNDLVPAGAAAGQNR